MSSNNWWSAISSLSDIAESFLSQASDASTELEQQHKKFIQEAVRDKPARIYLPWDPLFLSRYDDSISASESLSILEQDVMERILLMSQSPLNFIHSPANVNEENIKSHWNFSLFVPVAMRLLEIDLNLNRLHAKFSPKMDEHLFWFNYFCRILYIRAIAGMDGKEEQDKAKVFSLDSMIHYEDSSVTINNPIATKSSNDSEDNNPIVLQHEKEEVKLDSPLIIDDEDIDMLLDDMLLDDEKDHEKEVDGYLLPNNAINNSSTIENGDNTIDDEDAELERQIARELAEDDDL